MQFMMITNQPSIAEYIERNGVHRIFLDQEVLGKKERQGHLNTHKASHSNEDVRAVREKISCAELMVRVNPLNPGSKEEIDNAIAYGAQRLMLPMFSDVEDVLRFRKLVAGRVPITLLAETEQSLKCLVNWIEQLDIGRDEVHIGLNDLSLDLGMKFLFEPLARGIIDEASQVLNRAGITWGFGGVARVGSGELPAEKLLGEHIRLGSTRVILSRAFHQNANSVESLLQQVAFEEEIRSLNYWVQKWTSASQSQLAKNSADVAEIIVNISEKLK